MKLLLDENLPKKLKLDFPEHEIYTVSDKGWNGIQNRKLLKLLIEENFDALITFDKNLQYQQNFKKYTINVFVLTASINTYSELTKLSPKVKAYLDSNNISDGPVIVIS
jgi:predicted nuclease of predicted toxin-antitoxin system